MPKLLPLKDAASFLAKAYCVDDQESNLLPFADWLQEQGYPDRADLIRVQCLLCDTPDDAELRERERELLEKRDFAARCQAATLKRKPFDVGFSSACVTAQQFLHPGSRFSAVMRDFAVPYRDVTIRGVASYNVQLILLKAKELGLPVISLEVYSGTDASRVFEAIRAMPPEDKNGVVHLTVHFSQLSSLDALQNLDMPSLETLQLKGHNMFLNHSPLQRGMKEDHFLGNVPKLRTLTLEDLPIWHNDIVHVASSEGLRNLTRFQAKGDSALNAQDVMTLLGLEDDGRTPCRTNTHRLRGLETLNISIDPEEMPRIQQIFKECSRYPKRRIHVPDLQYACLHLRGQKEQDPEMEFTMEPAAALLTVQDVRSARQVRKHG